MKKTFTITIQEVYPDGTVNECTESGLSLRRVRIIQGNAIGADSEGPSSPAPRALVFEPWTDPWTGKSLQDTLHLDGLTPASARRVARCFGLRM